jgi:phosphopantothenoylcysteine decarboxylase/phosphopantothenate--cysteine ligase
VLITAGPTHEPIDDVRFIGNRSSGAMGIAIARQAARAGARVTLLLGPTGTTLSDPQIDVVRFRTTSDLQRELRRHFRTCDVLIMAAAVADYRPAKIAKGKLKRDSVGLTIRLESTPDLLAEIARGRRENQLLVGFALEPRKTMLESARAKLVRKGLDLIVANPLETMDAPDVRASVIDGLGTVYVSKGKQRKEDFAAALIDIVLARAEAIT